MKKTPVESCPKGKAKASCVVFVSPSGPHQVKARGLINIQRGAEISWAWEMVMVRMVVVVVVR